MTESANYQKEQNSRPDLTLRQRLMLSLVVREYTQTAMPVGSKSLVSQYGLDISSATVRNELARLEELGLLDHPHTSAGRVPTEKGYRYFVEHLMSQRELPLAERLRIRHQFHQLGLELNQWLQLSAAILADTVHNAALVTAPRAPQARFKHLELIATYGNAILLVLVLQDGTVRQQGLFAREAIGQTDLSNMSDRLSAMCRGLAAADIRAQDGELSSFEKEVLELVANVMDEVDRSAVVESYHEGIRHLLEQPEFHDSASFSPVMRLLESDWLVTGLLPGVFASNGVTVIIGGSSGRLNVGDLGLVLSRYGVDQELVGALGVLGPIRMHYERVIPAVRYMAQLLSGLIWDLFGPGEKARPPGSLPSDTGGQWEVESER